MRLVGDSIGELWLELAAELHQFGNPVSPRQLKCREILGVTLHLTDARRCMFENSVRKLSYRFMIAEWLWIYFGHDDVATIAQYAPHIADFSDNGINFNGSYGVPVKRQWSYILGKLQEDPDSRQAVIQIYSQPPGPTKDVPCTLALQFMIRNGVLHTFATMRSSDVWLGLPYDVFNFCMLGNILAAQLGVDVGSFTIHLGSSHLYEKNEADVRKILTGADTITYRMPQLPGPPPHWLDVCLEIKAMPPAATIFSVSPDELVWFALAGALSANTNSAALICLKEFASEREAHARVLSRDSEVQGSAANAGRVLPGGSEGPRET